MSHICNELMCDLRYRSTDVSSVVADCLSKDETDHTLGAAGHGLPAHITELCNEVSLEGEWIVTTQLPGKKSPKISTNIKVCLSIA